MTEAQMKAALCYVDGSWAFFTTQPLDKQWGDDWDDAPYEHNAERPYEYRDHDKAKGIEPWEIVQVAWEGSFDAPCDGHSNSPFSVEQINAGAIAWLRSSSWSSDKKICVQAGTTLARFIELIREGDGKVYLEAQ